MNKKGMPPPFHSPWKCNFCGGKLQFYSILDFGSDLRKALAKEINVPETAIFKVEKCGNKECGRTYIFIESHQGGETT